MAKFRKKPVVIDADQWFGHGEREGEIVRYFRRPDVDGKNTFCGECKIRLHDHGWIDTREGGHIVCPNDWIITGVKGETYPCKPDVFEATYEPAPSE